jgi:hypothetical protein
MVSTIVEEASILRRHGEQRNTKGCMKYGRCIGPAGGPRWNVEVKASSRDVPVPMKSNHDPRKRQPISKGHKKGASQSKVV